MTTLTFDYFTSPRPVEHTATAYSLIALGPNATGWMGARFPDHNTDIDDPLYSAGNPYVYDVTHHLAETIPILTEAETVAHSPGPDYFDLVSLVSGPNGRLFLRVTDPGMPTPPDWNLESHYATWADYTTALTAYQDKVDEWAAAVHLSGNDLVTHAELRDNGGKLGDIDASSPIEANQFTNFTAYETVVYGSKFNDLIGGGNVGDELFGEAGNDKLYAGTGPATLNGGEGKDSLFAARGDELTGGPGADRFIFVLDSDSPDGPLHDVITDFHHAQGDKIVLPFARHFAFIGHHPFPWGEAHYPHAAGLIRIAQGNLVEARFDGDHAPSFELHVHVHGSALGRPDFILHA